VRATIRNCDYNKGRKAIKENNTTHGTDGAAIFGTVTHTSMNET
jgi:hypothetical protein